MQQSIEVDLALIAYSDRLLSALELSIVKTARQHDATTLYRLQTVPGVGKIFSLGLLYDIHDSQRFPRVQDVGSSCRLVTCAKDSAGKRSGTAGKKIGNAYLQWAFAEAAVLFLRHHAQGQALTILAPQLARAVSYLFLRDTVCEMDTFLHGYGSRAGEPAASLDTHGISLHSRP